MGRQGPPQGLCALVERLMDFLRDERIQIVICTLGLLLLIGSIAFRFLEPFTWIQAFYFAVATMTTVGYGDLVPSSDWTRLLVAIYALISITMYVSLASFLGVYYLERREAIRKERD